MKKTICIPVLIGLGSLLGFGTVAPAGLALPPISQHSQNADYQTVQPKAQQSTGTLRQGLPGRRLGGGTRGNRVFSQDYAYLAALVTPDNLSLTTAAQPAFMFYVPEMVDSHMAEFVLRNAQGDVLYEEILEIDQTGGFLNIDTSDSETMPDLPLDENHIWIFSIVPDINDRAVDVVVEGNIQRVNRADWLTAQSLDPQIVEQLEQNDPLEQARVFYQEAQLWHDAAILLDTLRLQHPTDVSIAQEWQQLIETAGLDAVLDSSSDRISHSHR